MMDHNAFFRGNQIRSQLADLLLTKRKTISKRFFEDLQIIDTIFEEDVAELAKYIDENFVDGSMSIDVHFPVPEGLLSEGHPQTMTRRIALPSKDAPYYRAVLFIEAESAVREYCDFAARAAGLYDQV